MSNDYKLSSAPPDATEDALSAVMFANTPSYLAKHLIRTKFPAQLGEKLDIDQLRTLITAHAADEKMSTEKIVAIYAAVIALAARGATLPVLSKATIPWIHEVHQIASAIEGTTLNTLSRSISEPQNDETQRTLNVSDLRIDWGRDR